MKEREGIAFLREREGVVFLRETEGVDFLREREVVVIFCRKHYAFMTIIYF